MTKHMKNEPVSGKPRKKFKKKQIKSAIFYAHTYRHLNPNYKKMAAYYLLFVLPCIFIFLFTYSKITEVVSKWCLNILSGFVPIAELGIDSGEFIPYFGEVFFVILPNKLPSLRLIILNIIVVLLLLIVCYNVKDRAKPLAIYFTIGILTHLIACIFFLVMPESFPYTITQYSDLYMKQQVGIWLSFLVIASLVSGGISNSGISKFYMLFSVMGYSFIFGFLRYVVYLVVLLKASTLYMAMMFFTFGPFFDFLYLVCIYSLYMKFMTEKLHGKKGAVEWKWA